MGKLLDWFKGKSPTPKRQERYVTISYEEYELLQVAAWCKGERAAAQKKLKILNAWKLENGF